MGLEIREELEFGIRKDDGDKRGHRS